MGVSILLDPPVSPLVPPSPPCPCHLKVEPLAEPGEARSNRSWV